MPTPEQKKELTILRIITGAPMLAPQLLPLLSGFEDVNLAPVGGIPGASPPGTEGEEEPSGISGGDPETGGGEPPNPAESTPSMEPPGTPGDTALIERILGASDAAVDRALERAGARAVSRINLSRIDSSKLPAADRLRLDKSKALAVLGPADFNALGVDPTALLDGAWDDLATKVQGWVQPWIVARCGFNGASSVDAARSVADELCARLQTLTLADRGTRTYDDGMRVPVTLITSALETAAPVRW